MRAKGMCPGCYFDHDGSERLFCFECRVEQSAKMAKWYRRNRKQALARLKAKRIQEASSQSAATPDGQTL
jgi:hypothetical protein